MGILKNTMTCLGVLAAAGVGELSLIHIAEPTRPY